MPAPSSPPPHALTEPHTHPATDHHADARRVRRSRAHAWLNVVRVRQWSKNLLVLAAPLAAGTVTDLGVLRGAGVAFAVFCLAAGGCYLVNDAVDVQADRLHPRKRLRAVAAGEIRVGHAALAGCLLLATSVVVGWLWAPALGLTLAAYVVAQVAYLAGLKHQPAMDLAVVASGFLLRAVAGGVATGTPLSTWFLLVATFGALFMVTGKRYSELVRLGPDAGTRASLRHYSASYLRFVWTMAAGVTVVVYLMWALTGTAGAGVEAQGLPWEELSVAAFVLGLLRYAARVDQGSAEHPEEIVLSDHLLQVVGLVWAATVLAGALTR